MSVKQRKNGSWEFRYRDPEGVHRSRSFRRKSEAVAFENSVRDSIYRGIYQVPIDKKITVEEIYKQYLKSKRSLKPKSIEEIKTIWNHIISPTFAKTQASSINSERIYKWIDESAFGDAPKTSAYRMNKALGYFSRMMDFAIEHGYLAKNPLLRPNGKQIKVKTVETNNRRLTKALSSSELKELASHCGERKDMILLMGMCGLRWAEIVGLRVGDFSKGCEKLKISRTLSEIGGIFHETTTKTGQDRIIFIPIHLAAMLRKRISKLNMDDLVFANDRGKPLHNSNFRTRVLLPGIKNAGVPKVTLNDLRHTAASIAISNGADITSVARMLGHSDTSMTLKRYSHFYDSNMLKLSQRMNELLEAS
jgi:integrase